MNHKMSSKKIIIPKAQPILLAVLGMTPHVITETLYGIYKSGQPLPEKIIALTTEMGKDSILKSNFIGPNGILAKFISDYNLPDIEFNEQDIKVAQYKDKALNDARTREEQEALADFITSEVRVLTQAVIELEPMPIECFSGVDPKMSLKPIKNKIDKLMKDNESYRGVTKRQINKEVHLQLSCDKYSIHASIAGGRKSMTFLLGYAMSLFGRSHDTVSHVLVDEWVERCRDFYYPSPKKDIRLINSIERDFSSVQISLAEMPLVLMSHNMSDDILKENRSYSETIQLFNRHNAPAKMCLDINKLTFSAEGETILLEPEQMAFLWAWTFFTEPVAAEDYSFMLRVLSCYASLLSLYFKTEIFEDEVQALTFFHNEETRYEISNSFIVGNFNLDDAYKLAKEKSYVDDKRCGGIIGGNYYHNERDKLLNKLSKVLGKKSAEKYLPQAVTAIDKSAENRKGTSHYKLTIDQEYIEVINPPS
jgi:hypothetical protein